MTPPSEEEINHARYAIGREGVFAPTSPKGTSFAVTPAVHAAMLDMGIEVTSLNVGVLYYGINLGLRIAERRGI
jgi:hypothetical protein